MTIKPDTFRACHLDGILEGYYSEQSASENLTDLLVDAMHWCLLNGESFTALLITAQMHIELEAGMLSNPSRPSPVNGPEPEVRFPIGLRPLGRKLLALSDQTAEFAKANDIWLSFEDHVLLTEQKAALKAIARLLGSFNQDAHLADQIRQAEEYLAWMQARAELQAN